MDDNARYISPFSTRYAGEEMQRLFSNEMKFTTWRRLWVALAESEMELGLPVTKEQVDELKAHVNDLNLEVAAEREAQVRHDVMAQVYAYGLQCPKAKGIIHLGATSCYVGDNADVIIMTEGLKLVREKVAAVIAALADFARRYKDMPTLAYTHYQPAQPTTVGKRATLWIHDLMLDIEELDHRIENMRLLGSKGTTGTAASFYELFDGDTAKITELEKRIAEKMGFSKIQPVSGQTYSRKVDSMVVNVLSGVAQSAMKFATDLRLLQHMKEIEEPFEKNQIGSSAMPYKRNPMRSERICALARYIINDALNPAVTASVQWFERTLDDSANKRIAVAEAFLATDAVLNLYLNVARGLVVYPKMIEKHLMDELPFMATENIMMRAVKNGGDRQALHEAIRQHSMAAGRAVKEEGRDNDLLQRIAADERFNLSQSEINEALDPKLYVGCAPKQTEEYLDNEVSRVLERFGGGGNITAEVNV